MWNLWQGFRTVRIWSSLFTCWRSSLLTCQFAHLEFPIHRKQDLRNHIQIHSSKSNLRTDQARHSSKWNSLQRPWSYCFFKILFAREIADDQKPTQDFVISFDRSLMCSFCCSHSNIRTRSIGSRWSAAYDNRTAGWWPRFRQYNGESKTWVHRFPSIKPERWLIAHDD